MWIIEKYFSKERPISSLHDLSLHAFTCQNWIIICHKHYKKTKALFAINKETWSEDKTPRTKKSQILNRWRFITCNIPLPLSDTWKLYLYNSMYVIKMFLSSSFQLHSGIKAVCRSSVWHNSLDINVRTRVTFKKWLLFRFFLNGFLNNIVQLTVKNKDLQVDTWSFSTQCARAQL